MKKYRKPDQFYIDQYDRVTIEKMKEIDAALQQAQRELDEHHRTEDLVRAGGLSLRLSETGANASRNKRGTIADWMTADERKDRLIATNRVPAAPWCDRCQAAMIFMDHDFINDDHALLFLFSCGQGTRHNRILQTDGTLYQPPVRSCPYCNGALKSTVKRTKTRIRTKDSCTECTWSDETAFELPKPAKVRDRLQPVDEAERLKYCTSFHGSRTFEEDMQAIIDLGNLMEEDGLYDPAETIEMLKLPQVEEKLTTLVQTQGYVKLQFDQPKIAGQICVRFSLQDPTDRGAEKSVKTLKLIITDALFPTNWRLMTTDITYRLGYLDGQLKGVDQKADLRKIATEIGSKRS